MNASAILAGFLYALLVLSCAAPEAPAEDFSSIIRRWLDETR